MVRKFKKKTLFLAGIVGLSLLSLFGAKSNSQGDVFTESDLKDLLNSSVAYADVLETTGPGPTSGDGPAPCPSGGDCGPGGPGPMGLDDEGGRGDCLI